MGLMDKVKAQATQLADKAQQAGQAGQAKLADLQAKQWVILLYDDNRLCGFSTQVVFDFPHEHRLTRILFSGDTIIDKHYWGSLALPVAWGRLMLLLQSSRPDTDLFWLLTSKGYKTYRFLPVFFHEFYPCYCTPTPSFEPTARR